MHRSNDRHHANARGLGETNRLTLNSCCHTTAAQAGVLQLRSLHFAAGLDRASFAVILDSLLEEQKYKDC
jgi:hypothetical protein